MRELTVVFLKKKLWLFIIFSSVLSMIFLSESYCPARVTTHSLGVLPEREEVKLKLSGTDKALVREVRYLELQAGTNQIYLNYPGVRIIPSSLHIQFMDNSDKIRYLQTSTSVDNPSSFTWQVYSEKKGKEPVRVSYLVEGMKREYSYQAFLTEEEQLLLEGWLSLVNETGEEFIQAHLTGEVGGEWEISLRAQQVKKLPFFENTLPVEKIYILDEEKYGDKVTLQYRITNRTEMILLGGKIRIYEKNDGKLVFLGESIMDTLNPGESTEIPVSHLQDVKVDRKLIEFSRTNVRRDNAGNIELYDTKEEYQIQLRNQKKEKVSIMVRKYIPDTWEIVNSRPSGYVKEDAHHIIFKITLSPGEEQIISYKLQRLNLLPGEPVKPLVQ